MNIAADGIKLLLFLLPGFLAMKVVALKVDLKRQSQHETFIDALLYSMVVYMGLGALGLETDLTSPSAILSAIVLALLVGLVAGEAKSQEWISRLLAPPGAHISSHDKIFLAKAAAKLFRRWNVIGLKNGKEVFGIIRNVDTNTNEMLVEDARWMVGGKLVGEPSWLYLPPDTQLEYIRSVET